MIIVVARIGVITRSFGRINVAGSHSNGRTGLVVYGIRFDDTVRCVYLLEAPTAMSFRNIDELWRDSRLSRERFKSWPLNLKGSAETPPYTFW